MSNTTFTTEKQTQSIISKNIFRRVRPVFYALILLCIIGIITQPNFLTIRNLRNIILSTTPWAIATIGQSLALLTAGIDLSIGPVISLTNTVAAFLMKDYPEYALGISLLCIALGLIVGLVNGLVIAYLKLNPFLFTLASGTAIQGVTLGIMYQPGGMVTPEFLQISRISLGVLPLATFYILILYFVGSFILKRTSFGLSIYAVGGNQNSARLSGIRVERVLIAVYTISGFLASLAGLYIASRIGSGDPIVGEPISLDTITAAVLGGTSLFGGIGDLWGGLAGAFFIGTLSTTLNLNNVSPFYQWIVKGFILIAAMAIDLWRHTGNSEIT